MKHKVAPSLKVWDFMCDKASAALVVEDDPMEEGGPACKDPEYQARKLQTYRLKVLLEGLGELVMNMGKMVQSCCVDAEDPDPPKPPGLTFYSFFFCLQFAFTQLQVSQPPN